MFWAIVWPDSFNFDDQHNETCRICGVRAVFFMGTEYRTVYGSYATDRRWSFPRVCSLGCQQPGDYLEEQTGEV